MVHNNMKFIVVSIFILKVYAENFINATFIQLYKDKLMEALCQSFYKENELTCSHFEGNCNETSELDLENLTQGITLERPKLNCKEDDMANFVWNITNDSAYFLEFSKDGETKITNVTTCGSYTIENLTENTLYKIRLWSVSFSKRKVSSSDSMEFETSKSNSSLSAVSRIFVDDYIPNGKAYDAVIRWEPNEDLSCYYRFVWTDSELTDYKTVNVISDSHKIVLEELPFDKEVTGYIIALSSNSFYDSNKTDFEFKTGSCLEAYSSLDVCPPEKPKNVDVNGTVVEAVTPEKKGLCDINLSWSEPDMLPNHYEVRFVSGDPNNNDSNTSITITIPGNQSTATFEKLELDVQFMMSLKACSLTECGESAIRYGHCIDRIVPSYAWTTIGIVLPVIAGFIIISLVTALIIVINRYRAKQERKEKRYKYFTELEEKKSGMTENLQVDLIVGQDNTDHWEIDPGKLIFQNILGEGAFGIVRRGCLETKNGSKMEAAIKMLKDSPSSEEVRQFTQEIEIMKSVKHHPYIVSLIGCITRRRPGGPLLVVEYCSRGDLQTYLRNAWDKFSSLQHEINYIENGCSSSSDYFVNKTYDFQSVNLGEEFNVEPKHLVSIARQVALGMEHLSKTRVVHRDLAARNVLVCENHTVKVSDFGLSRDVYQDNVYCKSGGGRLPIRWMALESLTHQRYTTQSDVWSFGILLWEIATLGGTPYAGVHTSDLLDLLKNGYRLKCPSTCSPDFYAIMQSCWKASPTDRPTFSELSKSLENLLENVSEYLHLDNVEEPSTDECMKQNPEKVSEMSCTYERYVKPVNGCK